MGIRLAPKPLEIGPLDGFSKSDIFEAAETGNRLADIVGDLEGHSVIVFDGAWGTGKSVFVQQWAGLLRQRGHPVVYFDAFAHDHLDDAFFPLLAELLRAQGSGGHSLAPFRETLVTRAARLLRAMPGLLTDIAVRTATGGTVAITDIREAERAVAKREDAVRVMMEQHLDHVDNHREAVREFRAGLEDAVSRMEDGKPPLVFIIDELDRCRPTYALSILERMKHVFDANDVCFVLVTHLTALTAMVRRAYGVIDAYAYLHKFYHRRFDFEKLLLRNPERVRQRYFEQLVQELRVPRDPNRLAAKTIGNLIRIHKVPLRSQERIVLDYTLFLLTMKSAERGFVEREKEYVMTPFLVLMRHVDPTLYQLVSSQSVRFSQVMDFIKIDDWNGIESTERQMMRGWWRCTTIDGFKDATDEEKKAMRNASAWRSHVAQACSIIEQLAE